MTASLLPKSFREALISSTDEAELAYGSICRSSSCGGGRDVRRRAVTVGRSTVGKRAAQAPASREGDLDRMHRQSYFTPETPATSLGGRTAMPQRDGRT
ncbi:hypothetical protein KC345_g213 [Hortaea werneckii]|nr:hypothetical protein KC345_g213 [Hortaea werneckii]